MWQYIIIVFLLLASSYWIIRPLLRSEPLQDTFTPGLKERLDQATLKKEGAYATIKELEFDLSMGKLSREDFEILKEQYTLDALKYMEEIDHLHGSEDSEIKLSGKQSEERIEMGTPASDGSQSTMKSDVFCAQCGEKAKSEDLFCSKCGVELKKH